MLGVQAELRPKRSTIDQAFNNTILIYKHVNQNQRQGIFSSIRLQHLGHLIVGDKNDLHRQVLELYNFHEWIVKVYHAMY